MATQDLIDQAEADRATLLAMAMEQQDVRAALAVIKDRDLMRGLYPKKKDDKPASVNVKGRVEEMMESAEFRQLLKDSESWEPPRLTVAEPQKESG